MSEFIEIFLKQVKLKWKTFSFRRWFFEEHDHYQRATLITWLVALGLLIALIALGGFMLPDWFLDLYMGPALIGGILSGSTYIACLADPGTHRYEQRGTIALGVVTVAGVAALSSLGLPVTYDSSLGKFAYAVFGIRAFNVVGGLGYRTGALGNANRPTNEKRLVGFAAMAGAAIGSAVFVKATAMLTSTALATMIPGITLACAIPVVPGAILAGVVVASVCASAADYTGKAWNYMQYCRGKTDAKLTQRIEERKNEYRGAAVGTAIGLVVGGIIVGLTLPYLAIGLVGLAATAAAIGVAALTVTACVSVFGSLASKTGRYFDQRRKALVDSRATSPLLASRPDPENPDHGAEPSTQTSSPSPSPDSSPKNGGRKQSGSSDDSSNSLSSGVPYTQLQSTTQALSLLGTKGKLNEGIATPAAVTKKSTPAPTVKPKVISDKLSAQTLPQMGMLKSTVSSTHSVTTNTSENAQTMQFAVAVCGG